MTVGQAAGGTRQAEQIDAAGLARALAGLLGAQPGGAFAGLAGLEAAFGRAGLADAFGSWVGTGPNRPIGAAELERALGGEVLAGLARSVGADPVRAAAGLALLLPRVVDQLTPDGRLPSGDGDPLALARRLLGR